MANPTTSFPGQSNQGSTGQSGNQGSSSGSMMEKGKDAANYVADKAKGAASSVASQAQGAASYVGNRAGDATSAVGGSLKSLGDTIRETGGQNSMVGGASTAVADTLDSAGRYLQEEGLSGIAEDMTSMIRRNPIPALLIGVGIGFLLARATAPRSNY